MDPTKANPTATKRLRKTGYVVSNELYPYSYKEPYLFT